MGRELKRVPLTFDWPLEKTWEGFLNPFYKQQIKCPHCDHGYTPEYKKLESLWYSHQEGGFNPSMRGSVPYRYDEPLVQKIIKDKLARCDREGYSYYNNYGRLTEQQTIDNEALRMCGIWNSAWSHHLNELDVAALLKADRLWDFTRVWRPGMRKNAAKHSNGWLKKSNGYVPTPREVNDWSLTGFAHDSTNCWIVIKAELKRLGQPSECAHCKGHGYTWPSDKVRRQYNAWKPKEPPKGEGYQIWETTSEGSPISPVFATPEELAEWMATPGNGWKTDQGTTREQWLAFIKGPGWAPSFVSAGTGLQTGVQATSNV